MDGGKVLKIFFWLNQLAGQVFRGTYTPNLSPAPPGSYLFVDSVPLLRGSTWVPLKVFPQKDTQGNCWDRDARGRCHPSMAMPTQSLVQLKTFFFV